MARKVRAPQGTVPGNAWAARADGKCNRKIPPKRGNPPARVKWCGKSAPRGWQHTAARQTPPGARPNRDVMTWPASRPGRSLEPRGDAWPRGMAATVAQATAQNPAYRLTPPFCCARSAQQKGGVAFAAGKRSFAPPQPPASPFGRAGRVCCVRLRLPQQTPRCKSPQPPASPFRLAAPLDSRGAPSAFRGRLGYDACPKRVGDGRDRGDGEFH